LIINSSMILAFAMLGPLVVSVLLGVLSLPIPAEMLVYILVLFMILMLNMKTNSFKAIFLKNKVAMYSYIFVLLMVIFIPISISNKIAYEKMAIFIYLIISKVLIISLINFQYIIANYLKFLKHIKNFSLMILFAYFIFFHLGFTEYFNEDGRIYLIGTGNPIWFARYVADLTFVIIFYSFFTKKINISFLFALLLGISLLLEAGSRGPFLSLFLISTYAFIKLNPSKKKIIYFFLAFSLIFIAPFIVPKILDFNIFSIYARLDLYQKSIYYILDNPFGYGFGSFGLLYTGEDVRFYPHNIILEVFVELGIIGMFMFILLIYHGFKSHSTTNIFFYLFLIAFINAQFSGDLASNSYMFVYLFLSVLYKRYERRHYYEALSLHNGKYIQ